MEPLAQISQFSGVYQQFHECFIPSDILMLHIGYLIAHLWLCGDITHPVRLWIFKWQSNDAQPPNHILTWHIYLPCTPSQCGELISSFNSCFNQLIYCRYKAFPTKAIKAKEKSKLYHTAVMQRTSKFGGKRNTSKFGH